jgi:hypothetical protein
MTSGSTCFTKRTVQFTGVQTFSCTSALVLPIAAVIICSNAAARSAGRATMSTVPSIAVAILRSSSTFQFVPTPRQSHWNFPAIVSSTDSR